MAVESGKQLTAEDYAYQFPDHWLLDRDVDNTFGIVHKVYANRVVALVRDSGAQSVIEVGCGDGWNVGKLVEAGCKNVVGIDWSKNGIDHAKRMVPTAQFYCGNLTDSEFMDQFPDLFDAAILVEVLEHIPPQECVQALQNMIQFIRPGGTFVLTTPSTNYPNDNPYHYRHFTEPVLQELIEEVGNLDIISLEGYGDYNALQQMWMLRRWVDNRYYCIYGLKHWLAKQFAKKCHNPPLDRCMGFIVVMRKRG